MAVNDTWTALADFATNEVVTASKLNQQLRDNSNVLALATDGDQSGSTIKHRHKSGTFSNRPAAGEAGRFYYAMDIGSGGILFADDGSNWWPVGIQTLHTNLAEIDVVSDVSETDVYSRSIEAGLLGITSGLRLTLSGDLLINAGGSETLQLKMKLGATTAVSTTNVDWSETSNRRAFIWEILFINSAADAQKWRATLHAVEESGNPSMRSALGSSGLTLAQAGIGASAEDTSGALTFAATVKWNTSSANLSFRKQMAVLELL